MLESDLLNDVLKGNQSAIALVNALARVSQTIDDVYDQDTPGIATADINRVLIDAFIEIPRNMFYVEHFSELQPVIELGIYDWINANHFEKSPDTRRIAYITRDSIYMIVVTCARIIGGPDWAVDAGRKVREFIHSEDYEDYMRGST